MSQSGISFAKSFLVFALALALTSCASISSRLNVKPVKAKGYEIVNENNTGEDVDVKNSLVFGRYTVVEFTSEYCSSCQQIKPLLETLSMTRPDIAVRSYYIDRPGSQGIDWDSPLAKRYNIHSVPAFIIFNDKGVKIADGENARNQIRDLVNKENAN